MVHLLALVLSISVWQSDGVPCPAGTAGTDLMKERGYDLHGQTVVMTGGDGGVGKGVTEGLALSGARLILLAHSMSKTETIISQMKTSKNSSLEVVPVNLLSLASVREAAEKVLQATDRVDAVVTLAGMDHPMHPAITADGFESAIQMEYIGHFHLIQLLLPRLRASAGRVVHISTSGSDLHEMCFTSGQPFGCEALSNVDVTARTPNQRLDEGVKGNIFFGLYLKSMHARALVRREAVHNVTAYSFHPGLVASPSLQKLIDSLPPKLRTANTLCGPMPWFICLCHNDNGDESSHCPLSSGEGGVAGVYLTAAPKSELEAVNGQLTVLCGDHPVGSHFNYSSMLPSYRGPEFTYFDPYDEMVARDGLPATEAYLDGLYKLSESWVSEATRLETAESEVPKRFPVLLFALTFAAAVISSVARRGNNNASLKDGLLTEATTTA